MPHLTQHYLLYSDSTTMVDLRVRHDPIGMVALGRRIGSWPLPLLVSNSGIEPATGPPARRFRRHDYLPGGAAGADGRDGGGRHDRAGAYLHAASRQNSFR